jgi:formylglycine-generating enzyme required for sulfatase activity
MATFGRYEADRPLCETGLSTIYPVRSAEGGARCVIKVHQTSVHPQDETPGTGEDQAFLESAATQQKVAQFDATHWAPIHEFGIAPSGPFYVTDRYDFSVESLIDGHVNLDATGLHRLANSVVGGLTALRQACGRPHGNLKATNILIGGRRNVAKAMIVLSDPLPDSRVRPDAHAKADLRHLGQLLHELVLHHPAPQIAGYQIPESEHWRTLGKRGEVWRQLCNRLLHVNVDPSPLALEDLSSQLAALAPRRSRRLLWMAPVVVIAAVCVLVFGLWKSRVYVHEDAAVSAYEQCEAAASWLSPLYAHIVRDLPKGRTYRKDHPWVQSDPHLSTLEVIEQYAALFLTRIPPSKEDFSDEKNQGLRRRAVDANDARQQIEDLLFNPQARDYWPWLRDLRKYGVQLADVGRNDMNEFLVTRVIPIRDDPKALPSCLDAAIQLKEGWIPVDFSRLEPNSIAHEYATGRVTGAHQFLEQLRSLPLRHYRLEGEDRMAFDRLVSTADSLLQELKDPLNQDDPNTPRLRNELSLCLQELHAIRGRLTVGAREDIARLRRMIAEIEPQVMNREKWYAKMREEAERGISPSAPKLNAWYKAYLTMADRLNDDKNVFLRTYENREKFRDLREEVEGTRDSFREFVEDFNSIEVALNAFYQLHEHLPGARHQGGTLQALFDRCQGNAVCDRILQHGVCGPMVRALMDRVEKLRHLDALTDIDALCREALGEGSDMGARYAAWLRFDADGLPLWPATRDQWRQERQIQEALRKELPSRAPRRWQDELEHRFGEKAKTRAERFAGVLTDDISKRTADVPIFENISELPRAGDPNIFITWAQDLLDKFLVAGWSDQYDLKTFESECGAVYIPSTVSREAINTWTTTAKRDYARIPDPRPETDLVAMANELKDKIRQGREESKDDPNALLGLHRDETRRQELRNEIQEVAQLPAIKKYEQEIGQWNEPNGLPAKLRELKGSIESHSRPPEGRYLRILAGTIVFDPSVATGLASFEPIELDNLRVEQSTRLERATWSKVREDRSAFERTYTDLGEVILPKHIRARKDPTVILRLVPRANSQDPASFYMAIREITNEQYISFLNGPEGQDRYIVPSANRNHDYMPITGNRPTRSAKGGKEQHPVVWVTHGGAQAYARWLGGELPTASMYEQAARWSDPKLRVKDPDVYHVRAEPWAKTKDAWNRIFIDSNGNPYPVMRPLGRQRAPEEPNVAPLGAGDGQGSFMPKTAAIEKASFIARKGRWSETWPAQSQLVDGLELFDLIGNVWEWCSEGNEIWGGSCLSDPNQISMQAKAWTGDTACDLGFRVVVSTRSTPQ